MSTPTTKHSAAGPYLGFGLQTIRLCARLLLEPPTATVYIEHDDDISVHYTDGTRLLEQTKSAQTQNPVADWARDIWKSLHNWLEQHSPLTAEPPISFRLYVTPNRTGAFVAALSAAKTAAEVETLLALVQSQVDPAKKKTAAFKFAKTFLEASPEDQTSLATSFELICEDDPLESIRKHYRPAVAETLLDGIIAYAVGEAKRQTDLLLLAGKPAGLLAGPFQDQIRQYVQRTNLPALFVFSPTLPSSALVHGKLSCRPTFVRQLELINADLEQQLSAVSDYLRACSDKTILADQGVLLPHSLDAWNDTLLRRHKSIQDSIFSVHAHLDSVAQGTAVYAQCRNLDLLLETKAVPDHFLHGCFNDLSDRRELGWHPAYATLLDV